MMAQEQLTTIRTQAVIIRDVIAEQIALLEAS